jgi:tRNA (guanine-N7-)-methyltransferase
LRREAGRAKTRPVDNPARTAKFIAHRDERRSALQSQLATLLADRPQLTLEIGSGHGHFLTAYAAAHPAEFCVGIDIIGERVERAVRKRDRARLQNLVFIAAEAEEFVAALPSGTPLEHVFILFPDPWPKRRHHKKRILQPAFLAMLAARAAPGARLYFRTDAMDYFAAAQHVVREHPNWQPSCAAWPFDHQTVFQSRATAFGSLVAERRSSPDAQLRPKDSE